MKLITYFFSTLNKDLRLMVVSIQTNCTWIHHSHSNERSFFYPIKVFFLIEPRWFFIRGGEWRKPILCTVRIPTFGAPGQGQTLDVYLRPDYWVRPRHILRWRLATSLPHHCHSAGLQVPIQDCAFLHTCLVLDRPTRQDPVGSIDTLCGNLHREHRLE